MIWMQHTHTHTHMQEWMIAMHYHCLWLTRPPAAVYVWDADMQLNHYSSAAVAGICTVLLLHVPGCCRLIYTLTAHVWGWLAWVCRRLCKHYWFTAFKAAVDSGTQILMWIGTNFLKKCNKNKKFNPAVKLCGEVTLLYLMAKACYRLALRPVKLPCQKYYT